MLFFYYDFMFALNVFNKKKKWYETHIHTHTHTSIFKTFHVKLQMSRIPDGVVNIFYDLLAGDSNIFWEFIYLRENCIA